MSRTDSRTDLHNALRVFARVAEMRSFRGAAESLGVPRSTVSHMVQRLEEEFGTLLLHRSTRSVTLTKAGERLLEKSQAVFDAIAEARAAVRPVEDEIQGHLSVCVPLGMGPAFLAPRLPVFLHANPGVTLDVRFSDEPLDLIAEGVDVALFVGLPPAGDVHVKRLGRLLGGLAASPGYTRHHGIPARPEDLKHHHLVSLLSQRELTWVFRARDGGETVTLQHSPRLSCYEVEASLYAISSGVGIGWVSETARRKVAEQIDLVRILPDWQLEVVADLWLIYLDRRQQSPAASAFIDFVEQEVREAGLCEPEAEGAHAAANGRQRG